MMKQHHETPIDKYAKYESLLDRKPVQLITKGICDVTIFLSLNDQTGRWVDDIPEKKQIYCIRWTENTITIMHAADDEGMD